MIFALIFAYTFMIFVRLLYQREEEVSSCQDQLGEFRAAAGVLTKWLEETTEKVPAVQPSSSEHNLSENLQKVTVSHGQRKSKHCSGDVSHVCLDYLFCKSATALGHGPLVIYLTV